MNKYDLGLAIKIACIEKIPYDIIDAGEGWIYLGIHQKYEIEEYNPFKWGVLGALIYKYNVGINRDYDEVNCERNKKHISIEFFDEEGMKRSILEAIIETEEEGV